MYKVVRIEMIDGVRVINEFMFSSRGKAEDFFTKECTEKRVVDIRLFYCIPYGGEYELTSFVRKA